jgi:ELWxxDGT repeat protein
VTLDCAATVLGDRLVFSAFTPAAGAELRASHGTADGTELLGEVLPGPAGQWVRPVATGDRVCFAAVGPDGDGEAVWVWAPPAPPQLTSAVASPSPVSTAGPLSLGLSQITAGAATTVELDVDAFCKGARESRLGTSWRSSAAVDRPVPCALNGAWPSWRSFAPCGYATPRNGCEGVVGFRLRSAGCGAGVVELRLWSWGCGAGVVELRYCAGDQSRSST